MSSTEISKEIMSFPVVTIAEIGKHEGQSVTIRGWLYNLRESGKLLFPIFRDGSGLIQGVVPKNAVPQVARPLQFCGLSPRKFPETYEISPPSPGP